MRLGRIITTVVAAALTVSPALAAPAASVSTVSQPAVSNVDGESDLAGGGFIIAILAAAAVIAGIVIIANNNDKPNSP